MSFGVKIINTSEVYLLSQKKIINEKTSMILLCSLHSQNCKSFISFSINSLMSPSWFYTLILVQHILQYLLLVNGTWEVIFSTFFHVKKMSLFFLHVIMDSLVEYSNFRIEIIFFPNFVNLPVIAMQLPLLPFKSPLIVCGAVCVCSVMFDSLWPHGLQTIKVLCPWDFSGKNAGVNFHFLLHGIFQTQNRTHISELTGDSLPLSHLGSPNDGLSHHHL